MVYFLITVTIISEGKPKYKRYPCRNPWEWEKNIIKPLQSGGRSDKIQMLAS